MRSTDSCSSWYTRSLRDDSSLDADVDDLARAAAKLELDRRPGLAANVLNRIVEPERDHGLTVDPDDVIAGHEPSCLGAAASDDLDDPQAIVEAWVFVCSATSSRLRLAARRLVHHHDSTKTSSTPAVAMATISFLFRTATRCGRYQPLSALDEPSIGADPRAVRRDRHPRTPPPRPPRPTPAWANARP